jgi:CDP-glycerol glycerophosphotransferase
MSSIINRQIAVEFIMAARQFVAAILAWLLGYPLTRIVKRNKQITLVIGRRGPVFADNSKYYFIYASHIATDGERCIFLTGTQEIQCRITVAGGESVVHPSWRSFMLLLRCGKIVTDVAEWFEYGAYALTCGATRVQLWHGAPLKHIELDVYRSKLEGVSVWQGLLLRFQKWIIGRYPVYDAVVATSEAFIDKAFRRSFRSKSFLATGYPRNDALFRQPLCNSAAYRLSEINVDMAALGAVKSARSEGRLVILYAPTFRGSIANPFVSELDLARLQVFAQRNNLLFMLKLHPVMSSQCEVDDYENIVEYAPLGDVYPLMKQCDLLITDYSSIFFDFLLLDKPILFFAYDLKQYLNQDRAMYFEYSDMTPGFKCQTQAELEKQLETIIAGNGDDGFADMRSKVRRYTHDYEDDKSAERLYTVLLEQ